MSDTSAEGQIVLGYWNIRGLAQAIRYLLEQAGANYEDKRYQCGMEPPYDRSSWNDVKSTIELDFPNLPYLMDGDVHISQSKTILRYLGRKFGLTATTEQEHIAVDQIVDEVEDLRARISRICYGAFDQLLADFLHFAEHKISQLEAYMKKRNTKFIAGEKLTWADFFMYEVLDVAAIIDPKLLEGKETLLKFMNEVRSLPRIASYLASDRFQKYPLNNPAAQFGGSREEPHEHRRKQAASSE